MFSIKVSFTITSHFEKYGGSLLWHGKDINKQGKWLVKWDNVFLPKVASGLGVLDLRWQNRALLMKKVFKLSDHHNTP